MDVKIYSAALKIVSLNVRGVSNFKQRRTILLGVAERMQTCFFLQETHSNKATENQWQHEWGRKMLFSYGSPNSWGTTILINNKANCTVLCTVPDPLGRFIISKVQVCLSEMAYTAGCCSLKAQFIPLGIAFGSTRKRLELFRFYSVSKR